MSRRRTPRPQPYEIDNSPDVVPGRRVSQFFEVIDPVRAGELSVVQLQTILSGLPAVLESASLPVEDSDLDPNGMIFVGGGPNVSVQSEIKKVRSPERASTLAGWLGGLPMYLSSRENGLHDISTWVYFSAKSLVGNEVIYSAMVEASGLHAGQQSPIPPA